MPVGTKNFPTSLDTVLELVEVTNDASTQLNGALTIGATTVTVDSTSLFPSSGIITIDSENISYTGKTATTFTGCTRAAESTTAATHDDNATVELLITAALPNVHAQSIIAIETKLGINSSTPSSGTVLRGTGAGASDWGAIVNADIDASAAIAVSKLAALTVSRLPVLDASGFLSASSVTATEAGYLSGVTSAIQTQLDAKQAAFGSQTANYVYAGPTSGGAASPSFRALVSGDLPSHNQAWSTITSTPTTLSGYGITDGGTVNTGTAKRLAYYPSTGTTVDDVAGFEYDAAANWTLSQTPAAGKAGLLINEPTATAPATIGGGSAGLLQLNKLSEDSNYYQIAYSDDAGNSVANFTLGSALAFDFYSPGDVYEGSTYLIPSGILGYQNSDTYFGGYSEAGNNIYGLALAASTTTTPTFFSLTWSLEGVQLPPVSASAGGTNELRFLELAANGAHYVGFKSPDSLSASKVWTLPSADGSSGQVLSTNGSGVLSWASAGGGLTIGTTTITSGTTTRVLYNNAGVVGEYPVTGSTNVVMSASPTLTGTVAMAAMTASGTITQTSASATAFESGPNGGTNPVFRLVNSTASSATGLSVTGNAAGSGVTLTALSSGSDENITLVPKGTGLVTLGSATVGFYRDASSVNHWTFISSTPSFRLTQAQIDFVSNGILTWGDQVNSFSGSTSDVGLTRDAAGILRVTNASSGAGGLLIGASTDTGVAGALTIVDATLRRNAAANFALGATDAASPVAQTLSVQNVVAGTSNTAGVAWMFKGSAGTGTGAGGRIVFQTAPAGSSGTTQNSFVEACAIESSGTFKFKTLTFANLPTAIADGEVFYCSDGAVTSGADNTLTSGGSGALAVRINGVWRAFNAQN